MNQLGDCSDDTACEATGLRLTIEGVTARWAHTTYRLLVEHWRLKASLQTIRPLEYAFLYVLYLTHLVSSHNSGILLQLQNTSIHIKYVVRSFGSIQRKKYYRVAATIKHEVKLTVTLGLTEIADIIKLSKKKRRVGQLFWVPVHVQKSRMTSLSLRTRQIQARPGSQQRVSTLWSVERSLPWQRGSNWRTGNGTFLRSSL